VRQFAWCTGAPMRSVGGTGGGGLRHPLSPFSVCAPSLSLCCGVAAVVVALPRRRRLPPPHPAHAVPPTRAGGGWALTPRRPRRPLPPAVPHPAAAPTRSASPSAPLPRPALASRTQPRKRGALATCHPHRSLGSSPAVTATAGGPLFLYTGPATHVSVAGGGDGESKCRQMRPTCSVLVVAAVLALPADHSRYPNFFDRA